jgi:hypothetical protein
VAQNDTDELQQGAIQPSKAEIRERVDHESRRRARLGVPAFAGGILYLLGAITLNATVNKAPRVGALQGIAPALGGQPNPPVSPRAAEVRFFDHHAFGLIAGAVLSALGIALLGVILLFLYDMTRFRRPQTTPFARVLILVGAIAVPLLTVLGYVVQAIDSHNFLSGHDFTTSAVEHALTKNAAYEILGFAVPLCAIALVAGMITLMVGAVRAGLLPRWFGIVGGVGAVIVLIPSPQLSLITAFWMVGVGLLLMGRFPGGDPPAWAAGEARPWPSQLEARAQREARRGGGQGGEGVPEPVQPGAGTSARARKRRARK